MGSCPRYCNDPRWTATIEQFNAEAKTYAFKATANGNWDDYKLPDGTENKTHTFDAAGIYTLTFTVDTKNHTLTFVAEPFHTYTVAGDNANMFGTTWDATNTNNDMTKNADGTYSITYTNIELTGNVKYKVVVDHAWTTSYGDPNNNEDQYNKVIGIKMAGKYDITIVFDPTNTTKPVSEIMAIYKGISDAGYATLCARILA